MATFLGIDCGGSTTRTCLIDSDGNVLFRGRSGPGNLASTPRVEIELHLKEALADAPSPDFACGCFAGLLTDADRQRAIALLATQLPDSQLAAHPDYYATLFADPDTNLVLIAGTGALVASQTEKGIIRSAGGGPLLGDQGSAFDIARTALRNLLLSPNPPLASPLFWDTVIELFGSRDPNQVQAAIYRSVSPAARIAKLAPIVVVDSTRGMPYAKKVVDQAIRSLVNMANSHIQTHHAKAEELTLRLAGGLWEIDEGFLIKEFENHLISPELRNLQPHLTVEKLSNEPVLGAANLARQLAQQSL